MTALKWKGIEIDYTIDTSDGPGLRDRCSIEWEVTGIADSDSLWTELFRERCLGVGARAMKARTDPRRGIDTLAEEFAERHSKDVVAAILMNDEELAEEAWDR